MSKYRGVVMDRLSNLGDKKTRWYNSYEEVYNKAQKLKGNSGDRFQIRIDEK